MPRSSGAEGRFGNHAGNRIATEPALISKMRSRVREKDGFLWGLGGASNITCVLSPNASGRKTAARMMWVAHNLGKMTYQWSQSKIVIPEWI